MSNRSRYITRLFDAVSRASGDGVRWVLQVTGSEIVDREPEIMLMRVANGKTTHFFGDHLKDHRKSSEELTIDTLDKGRILMRKDMMLRRSAVLTRPEGDKRRDAILACIRDYNARIGRSPSHSEISQAVGMCRNTVEWHLGVLQQFGSIDIIPGKPYGIILKEDKS